MSTSTPLVPSIARGRATRVVVATSVMLSFISFWRAAAIVLNDLGSSAYYVGGIAEQAMGRASPWFVLGVMLFSYAVRAVYVESCAMFTRGGVYRVVKEAMGGTLAKLSVSALMFDYILTGPISGVSAGQYIVGLVAQTATYFGHPWNPSSDAINLFAAGIAVLVTLYFWWRNTRGIHESSDDALKIMYVTTVMVVLLIGWCGLTILGRPSAQRCPRLRSLATWSSVTTRRDGCPSSSRAVCAKCRATRLRRSPRNRPGRRLRPTTALCRIPVRCSR